MQLCERCEKNEGNIRFGRMEVAEILCRDCYNAILSEELGVELEEYPDSLTLQDKNGGFRYFNISKEILSIGIRMVAEENIAYGYRFEVYGEFDVDQQELFQSLVDKVKKGLAKTYIKEGTFPNGQMYETLARDRFIGRIEYNENNSQSPIIVIDGKPYSWDEIGKMMLTYEGFQLKVEILEE